MKTLIVLNQADVQPPSEEFDFVIGVDGGCKWCLENNITIDLAIGDFDSLAIHHFEQLPKFASSIEQHPSNKDQTDLELAIEAALNHGTQKLTVLGVWGGRTDHALANLFCLAQQSNSLPVVMPGMEQNGYLLKSGHRIIIEHEIGQTVSIMAVIDYCQGVSNTGMKYPLTNALVNLGTGLGLSNQTIANPATISLDDGVLLVLTDSSSNTKISH